MLKEMVKVGVANDGEKNLEIEVIKEWKPKNINYFGDTVYFKHEDKYYTMKTADFRKIFNS